MQYKKKEANLGEKKLCEGACGIDKTQIILWCVAFWQEMCLTAFGGPKASKKSKSKKKQQHKAALQKRDR